MSLALAAAAGFGVIGGCGEAGYEGETDTELGTTPGVESAPDAGTEAVPGESEDAQQPLGFPDTGMEQQESTPGAQEGFGTPAPPPASPGEGQSSPGMQQDQQQPAPGMQGQQTAPGQPGQQQNMEDQQTAPAGGGM